jgi:hypothetical protein
MSRSDAYAAVLNTSWLYEDADFAEVQSYLSAIPWQSGTRNTPWSVDVEVGQDNTGIVITFTQQTGATITVSVAVGERLIHQVFQAGIDSKPVMLDPGRVMNFVNQQQTITKFYFVPSAG